MSCALLLVLYFSQHSFDSLMMVLLCLLRLIELVFNAGLLVEPEDVSPAAAARLFFEPKGRPSLFDMLKTHVLHDSVHESQGRYPEHRTFS